MDILDKQKLRMELARINKSHAWLARRLGFSKQYLSELIKKESTKHVEDIAEILDTTKRSLIK